MTTSGLRVWATVKRVCHGFSLPYAGTYTERHGVLGVRADRGANWDISILSANHNAAIPSEIEALKSAHPGESEVALNNRVLGGIAITRGHLSSQSTEITADRNDQLSVTTFSRWTGCGVPRSS
jgi:hypothetical protein